MFCFVLFHFPSLTYFDSDATDVGLFAPCVRQQDILRLQVTVDDSFVVEDAHGSSDLLQEHPQCLFSQGSLGWRNKKKDKIQIQITKRNVCGHPEHLSSQLDGGRFVVLKYPRPSASLSGV